MTALTEFGRGRHSSGNQVLGHRNEVVVRQVPTQGRGQLGVSVVLTTESSGRTCSLAAPPGATPDRTLPRLGYSPSHSTGTYRHY